MIILDTNVVSEAMKPLASPNVLAWLNAQAVETVFISSVTLAELMFGIAALPEGKRKQGLSVALDRLLALFTDRVLAFDADAAKHYAELAAKARALGKGFLTPDGYIGAIAVSRGFIVATRDPSPFEAAGIPVINP